MKNPRGSRRKEILKIRAEINAKETKETIAKINKSKSCYEKLGALPHLPDLPLPVLSDRVSLQRGGAVHAQGGPHEGHAHEAVGGGHSRGHPDSNR